MRRAINDYGMVLVLAALCLFFSIGTLSVQSNVGAAGGEELAAAVQSEFGNQARVAIVAGEGRDEEQFTEALQRELKAAGITVVSTSQGPPSLARQNLEQLTGEKPTVVAASNKAYRWSLLRGLGEIVPSTAGVPVKSVRAYRYPNFLKRDNLLNIANQIAVIAILAIGMTFVIISGGIDLSVGSVIALSAVVCCLMIEKLAGGAEAGTLGMLGSAVVALLVCALVGFLTGFTITRFKVPAFIVTLGTMLMTSGAAFLLTQGESIYQLPDSFVWLGRGAILFGIPNAVILMAGLYLVAHVVMSRTTIGRYVYAVGGNAEAARLAGVRVNGVTILVYTVCSLLAGLGGVVMASQLKSGSPTYGQMYELYVIAAVVVGGTSLAGGEGKVLGTLIGAFIIAVIQNGMNLMGVESYTQKVVLGAIIVAAVLVDRIKRRGPRS